ncbi:NIPSNAP family protein [Actinophytocola glycyrrhizae]|uniref:NIPSNAP family protein n=1 Tax=Actinophytocola glycyrrhizae TaxID=2044873 RepID=A0ABV9S0N3_9PSEU
MADVLELRQYTLRPGRRDDLIDLFDREFVETQEAVGAQVLGQFRDLDDENRFVWLRGFADMPARGKALAEFYGGPVWAAHRDSANDTMIDSDDVLLLCPVTDFTLSGRTRGGDTTLVTVTLYHLPSGGEDAFLDFFADAVRPLLTETGAPPLAVLRTLRAENNFPALPVREDANVVAWVGSFRGPDDLAEHVRLLGRETRWTHDTLPELTRQLGRPPEQLQLAPTSRSLIR